MSTRMSTPLVNGAFQFLDSELTRAVKVGIAEAPHMSGAVP